MTVAVSELLPSRLSIHPATTAAGISAAAYASNLICDRSIARGAS